MAELTGTSGRAPSAPRGAAPAHTGLIRGFMQATEIDARMLGMIIALAVVWIGFQWITGWRISGSPSASPTACS